ncbi:hypothetical protein AKJ09_03897 [Labilithrix luteola]|uniref:Uncharacterized protein n=1 Tax=Labilithrix luteola TaxID=1391654 RepID=A0A0K1PUM7_9BACT|nr:hypothetical protein AKJ09_03897 [Labilithrix luteola]
MSYARWLIVRRKEDGQLFFAPSSWHDEKGRTVSAPEAITRAQSGRSQVEE